MNEELIKTRLKELFDGQTQAQIGKRIGIEQASVSRLMKNDGQLPKIDTLYQIAKGYKVSVDWILGLSDVKTSNLVDTSYATATKILCELIKCGADYEDDMLEGPCKITIKDPIMQHLLRKSLQLSAADDEIYENWKNNALSVLADKELLMCTAWNNETIKYMVYDTSKTEELLKVYEEAERQEDALIEEAGNKFKDL